MTNSINNIEKVSILGSKSIHVGYKLNQYICNDIKENFKVSNIVIISDQNLEKLHLNSLFQILNQNLDCNVFKIVIKSGERSKSRLTKASIEDQLFALNITRDSILIALGGGVIGDLVGFVAATYMRGIPVMQIPTSLLSMVDSSIGGKTAIDTPNGGKNLIGAFHQPLRIYVDLAYLETLPKREFSNGMAEIIKTAAISSIQDFEDLETNSEEINKVFLNSNRNLELILDKFKNIILSSIKFKAYVVTIDEKESGLRSLLNFGHTIGHAIEALYSPKLLHGECISIGMILEAEVSRCLGILNQVTLSRLTKVIKSYDLPTFIDDPFVRDKCDPCPNYLIRVMEMMKSDKKNKGIVKRVVLLKCIGKTYSEGADEVEDKIIQRVIANSLKFVSKVKNDLNFLTTNHKINESGPSTPHNGFLEYSGPSTPSNVSHLSSKHQNLKQDIKKITVPGSKSISNRALLLASLGKGKCKLSGLLHSDDTRVMLDALKELFHLEHEWKENGEQLEILGCNGFKNYEVSSLREPVYLGNAGTAARFLTSVCAFLSLNCTNQQSLILTGNHRMKVRPIGPLIEALSQIGASVKYLEKEGCLPIQFLPSKVNFKNENSDNEPIIITVSASISSQYVSSILMAAPYFPHKKGVLLKLEGGVTISKPYIDMTIKMMQAFGIQVTHPTNKSYLIPNGTYTNPSIYIVEGDASSATYPLSFAAITGTAVEVTNLGYNSMQGDAHFAMKILKPMGCTVSQTETSTLVQGPPLGELSCLGKVDMELLTDAFLTLAVLSAVAIRPPLENNELQSSLGDSLITEIVGIANQRVKECNRIQAMVTELVKIGVNAYELEDGLAIQAISIMELQNGFSNLDHDGIECYDDHRVAMSFSLLGTILDNLVIKDKRCIEKTFPNWFDLLGGELGVEMVGYELSGSKNAEEENHIDGSSIDLDKSVVLIGMRGVGKTTIGKYLASGLNFSFIDLDQAFVKQYNMTINDFVVKMGWDAFRSAELEIFKHSLNSYNKKWVIATGGGIVESSEARNLLNGFIQSKGIVLFLKRDINKILTDIENNKEDQCRPAFLNNFKDVYSKRLKFYNDCSNFTIELKDTLEKNTVKINCFINNLKELENLEEMKSNLCIIPTSNYLNQSIMPSYFISLTFPDLSLSRHLLYEVSEGCAAIELRVDLLNWDWEVFSKQTQSFEAVIEFLEKQFSVINEEIPNVSTIFTVRTQSQGGKFPDNCLPENLILLFEIAIKSAVNFIDLQSNWSKTNVLTPIDKLVKQSLSYTQIIISNHDFEGKFEWTYSRLIDYASDFEWINPLIIKMVSYATHICQNFQLFEAAKQYRNNIIIHKLPYLIALNMGKLGALSRAFNNCLTPVTHQKLESAAPGQLSIKEINSLLDKSGFLEKKQFYLFGTPISKSPSPTFHNFGFEKFQLPYEFELCETDDVEVIKNKIGLKGFGGASVTIPNKVLTLKLCDHLTVEAKSIGAVNTLIPIDFEGKIKILGDNTDWIAIFDLIKSSIVKLKIPFEQHIPLVFGSGGTSRAALFSLFRLGFSKVYLINRSEENAKKLINEFEKLGDWKIIFINISELSKFDFTLIIDTLPANSNIINQQLVDSLFFDGKVGVLVRLAYSNYGNRNMDLILPNTVLLITGEDIFLKQAECQFTKWTNLPIPTNFVKDRVKRFLSK